MGSGNGRAAWSWDEALCGVVPPLLSLTGAPRERVAETVRRHFPPPAR